VNSTSHKAPCCGLLHSRVSSSLLDSISFPTPLFLSILSLCSSPCIECVERCIQQIHGSPKHVADHNTVKVHQIKLSCICWFSIHFMYLIVLKCVDECIWGCFDSCVSVLVTYVDVLVRIYCVLYCLHCVFVLSLLCVFILICFVYTSVRTTATE
jgi:hypothetical protein